MVVVVCMERRKESVLHVYHVYSVGCVYRMYRAVHTVHIVHMIYIHCVPCPFNVAVDDKCSAYRRVDSVSSNALLAGEMVASTVVWCEPFSVSRRRYVNIESRNGRSLADPPLPSVFIMYPSVERDLRIDFNSFFSRSANPPYALLWSVL